MKIIKITRKLLAILAAALTFIPVMAACFLVAIIVGFCKINPVTGLEIDDRMFSSWISWLRSISGECPQSPHE
jgi:hypothetical protein